MARRRYGKKRYNKKGGWGKTFKKMVSYGGTAVKALSLAKTAIGLLNAEHKFIDSPISGVNIPSTGSITLLSATAEGDGASQRNGRSIKLKDMYLRFELNRGTVDNLARVLVVRQTMTNGAVPPLADLFADSTNVMSGYNKEFMGQQYQILHDSFHTITTDSPLKFFKKKIFLNSHEKFQGSGATAADVSVGAIFLVIWGRSASATPGTYNAFVRINFMDN